MEKTKQVQKLITRIQRNDDGFFLKKRKVGAKFPIWNYGSKNVMRAYFLLQSAWLSEVTLVLPSYFVLLTDQLSGIFRA